MVVCVGAFMGEGGESSVCCCKVQRLFPHIEGLAQDLRRGLIQRCQPCVQTAVLPSREHVCVFLDTQKPGRESPIGWWHGAGGGLLEERSSSLSRRLAAVLGEDVLILLPTPWISWEDFLQLNISQ